MFIFYGIFHRILAPLSVSFFRDWWKAVRKLDSPASGYVQFQGRQLIKTSVGSRSRWTEGEGAGTIHHLSEKGKDVCLVRGQFTAWRFAWISLQYCSLGFFYFFFSFYDLCTMAGLCFVLVSEAGPLHLISWSEGKGLDADCTVRDQENHYPCVMKTCPASLHPTEVQDLEATSATTLWASCYIFTVNIKMHFCSIKIYIIENITP